jgi:hypothetical protein
MKLRYKKSRFILEIQFYAHTYTFTHIVIIIHIVHHTIYTLTKS